MSDGRDDTQARPAGGVKPSPNLLQKWSRAPYWGPDEGVALAFGLDPARVIKSDIAGYGGPYLRARDPAPHFADFAHRAMAKGDLEHHAHPSDFINWAETVGLAFHDDWTSTLNPRIPAGPGDPVALPANSPTGVFRVEVEAAYRQRVEEWPENERHPTRDEDVKWMKDNFGVARARSREIRNLYAPDNWQKDGAPKSPARELGGK